MSKKNSFHRTRVMIIITEGDETSIHVARNKKDLKDVITEAEKRGAVITETQVRTPKKW